MSILWPYDFTIHVSAFCIDLTSVYGCNPAHVKAQKNIKNHKPWLIYSTSIIHIYTAGGRKTLWRKMADWEQKQGSTMGWANSQGRDKVSVYVHIKFIVPWPTIKASREEVMVINIPPHFLSSHLCFLLDWREARRPGGDRLGKENPSQLTLFCFSLVIKRFQQPFFYLAMWNEQNYLS